jgi:phosphoribosylaminoimidazole-succinocarboxamide synthase
MDFKTITPDNEIKDMVEAQMGMRMSMDDVKEAFDNGLVEKLKGAELYAGKVRANFWGGSLVTPEGVQVRIMLATDSLSAKDKVRGWIPFKGQILTEISNYILDIVKDVAPSSQLATAGNVVIAENCRPLMFEMILRQYMAKSSTSTSLYQHYFVQGKREYAGHSMPNGLVANQRLPDLIDTPSTKAEQGEHDVTVSGQYLVKKGIVTKEEYETARKKAVDTWKAADERIFKPRGIILVDTKYELGYNNKGEIVFIDEVLTPDASRYWFAADYDEKFAAGKSPVSYSKEIARDMVDEESMLTDDQAVLVGIQYVKSYEMLTGKKFEPDTKGPMTKICNDIGICLDELKIK